MHYRRWRLNGSPDIVKTRERRRCSVDECGRPAVGRGYCNKHYLRLMKYGDAGAVDGTAPGEAQAYLVGVVLNYDGDECLIWPYYRNEGGYGVVGEGDATRLVSRLVCEHEHGAPPTPKHEAAHSCGNGHLGCCTKSHLRWATRKENQGDRLIHGTSPRGENCGNAKLTEQQVQTIRALRGVKRQIDIAHEYGIAETTVCEIQNRKLWAWLK
jgi:hypothetical protein|nr:HNH endonuclease [Chelativorans multitrophicus]